MTVATQRDSITLITGANGEVGHGLIRSLAATHPQTKIVTLDLQPLSQDLQPLVWDSMAGSILDDDLLQRIRGAYRIDAIYHLAALLSTSGEKNPLLAHDVNVNGSLKLLELAAQVGQEQQQAVKFLFPSSVAVFGMPDVETKTQVSLVCEDEFLSPITMYGINKLYVEHLGRYYGAYYGNLTATQPVHVDFRSVRFPGIISADTVPSGGTSDYGPEMLHAAAQGKPYECFVREDSTIPFMTMPDAIQALLQLAQAPQEALRRNIYNVTGFSLSAQQFAERVQAEYPQAQITFVPQATRQHIIDSWPAALDDSAAQRDWGWHPQHNQDGAFCDYLLPNIRDRYPEIIV